MCPFTLSTSEQSLEPSLDLGVRISPCGVFIPMRGPAPVSCLWPYGELRAAGFVGIHFIFGLSFIDLRFLSGGILHYRCWPPSLGLNYCYQFFPQIPTQADQITKT